MQTHPYTAAFKGTGTGALCKTCHQMRLVYLAAYRGAVFAVECDIKDTRTKLLHHLGLQLQAFDHPRLHAAVVVAYGQ
jgi:hypothetical protein